MSKQAIPGQDRPDQARPGQKQGQLQPQLSQKAELSIVELRLVDTDADADDATDSTAATFATFATFVPFVTFATFASFASFATLAIFDTFYTFELDFA